STLLLSLFLLPLPYIYTCFYYVFFTATATTEIYPLSLHDALPIHRRWSIRRGGCQRCRGHHGRRRKPRRWRDRSDPRQPDSRARWGREPAVCRACCGARRAASAHVEAHARAVSPVDLGFHRRRRA